MPAQWLSNSGDIPGRASSVLGGLAHALSRPERQRQLRLGLLALFALWGVSALARLFWGLLPLPEPTVEDAIPIINPVQGAAKADSAAPVDIERMMSWHLFGKAGVAAPELVEREPAPAASSREGIEKGARESRLDLTLRGVVASTDDGLGHAIIEYRNRQAVYAVGDKMPVPGQVELAKVLSRQVVLDNQGTYELLTLFDDAALDAQLATSAGQPAPASRGSAARRVDKREDESTSALARGFRDRLYQDPQSLAEVVNVSAVRQNGDLLGYRVSPGKQRRQFEQLGFREGDLITGINGIALDNPANTMRLYQAMRTANEAVFDVERGGEALSISMRLESGEP